MIAWRGTTTMRWIKLVIHQRLGCDAIPRISDE